MSVQRRKINMKKASQRRTVETFDEYKMIRPMKRSGPRRNITNDELQPNEYEFGEMGMGTRPRKNKIYVVSSGAPSNKNYQPTPNSTSFKPRNN